VNRRNDKISLLPPTFEPWYNEDSGREVVVLMSGGVDSTLTALLLKEAGWDVLGLTMYLASADGCENPDSCCGSKAAFAARSVGIKHYFMDARTAFSTYVIERFRKSYFAGKTPNPCVDCNTVLKFDRVWRAVEEQFGIKYLATGHYARVEGDKNETRLCKAADRERDQSYFIYGVPRDRLPFLQLPLGEYTKRRVRELAEEKGLDVADKPDSMELCFAGQGDYRRALGVQDQESEGPIYDLDGTRLGTHNGIWNYTIGQRRGLGIAAGEPLYVVKIQPEANALVVGRRPEVFWHDVRATNLNILFPAELQPGRRLYGKVRSYNSASEASVSEVSETQLQVKFEEPVFAPTPGQHLVLYNEDDAIVAGGEIV